MLFFGHIGITVALFRAYDVLAAKRAQVSSLREPGVAGSREHIPSSNSVSEIDYRLPMIGAILPDLIDKPVWLLAGGGVAFSGRDYTHTLLFNLILLTGGLFFLAYRKRELFIISLSSLGHLVLDQLWNSPATLFWPLLGPLPPKSTTGFLGSLWQSLHYPDIWVPELIGLAVLLPMAYHILKRKNTGSFIRHGVVERGIL